MSVQDDLISEIIYQMQETRSVDTSVYCFLTTSHLFVIFFHWKIIKWYTFYPHPSVGHLFQTWTTTKRQQSLIHIFTHQHSNAQQALNQQNINHRTWQALALLIKVAINTQQQREWIYMSPSPVYGLEDPPRYKKGTPYKNLEDYDFSNNSHIECPFFWKHAWTVCVWTYIGSQSPTKQRAINKCQSFTNLPVLPVWHSIQQ